MENTAIFNSYRDHLATNITISDQAWKLLESIIHIGQLKKGEFSLEEGKVCTHIDFLFKGSLRAFINKDGSEVTTALYTEGICVTNMKSLTAQTPSTASIQALEDVVYARIKKSDLQKLYDLSSELQKVGRSILETMIIEENDWKEMYSLYDPEERYLFMLKKSPELVRRISLQYIASFLGIRRETLSRIRNRTAKEK